MLNVGLIVTSTLQIAIDSLNYIEVSIGVKIREFVFIIISYTLSTEQLCLNNDGLCLIL